MSWKEQWRTILSQRANGVESSKEDIERMLDAAIDEMGLRIAEPTEELDEIITNVILNNKKAVADFKSGNNKAIGSLIGQIVKLAKNVDPKVIKEKLMEKLK